MSVTDAHLAAFFSVMENFRGLPRSTGGSVSEELGRSPASLTAHVDYKFKDLPEFEYSTLRHREIRVVTFEQGGNEDGPIRLRIHHVRKAQCKKEGKTKG